MSVPLAGVSSQKPNTLSLLQDFSSSAPIGVPIMPAGRATRNLLSYQDSNLKFQNQNLTCYHYTITQFEVLSVGIKVPSLTFNSHPQVSKCRICC